MRPLYMVLAAAALFGSACSSDATMAPVPPVDHDAQGSWGQDTQGVLTPGTSFIMALNESAGAITGTGSFAGEAGPFGGLAVSGTVTNDSLHLRIIFIFDPTTFPQLKPDTAQYAGELIDADHMQGQIARDGGTATLNLVRLVIDDPPSGQVRVR